MTKQEYLNVTKEQFFSFTTGEKVDFLIEIAREVENAHLQGDAVYLPKVAILLNSFGKEARGIDLNLLEVSIASLRTYSTPSIYPQKELAVQTLLVDYPGKTEAILRTLLDYEVLENSPKFDEEERLILNLLLEADVIQLRNGHTKEIFVLTPSSRFYVEYCLLPPIIRHYEYTEPVVQLVRSMIRDNKPRKEIIDLMRGYFACTDYQAKAFLKRIIKW